jgi:hypothetical protein
MDRRLSSPELKKITLFFKAFSCQSWHGSCCSGVRFRSPLSFAAGRGGEAPPLPLTAARFVPARCPLTPAGAMGRDGARSASILRWPPGAQPHQQEGRASAALAVTARFWLARFLRGSWRPSRGRCGGSPRLLEAGDIGSGAGRRSRVAAGAVGRKPFPGGFAPTPSAPPGFTA